MAQGVQSSTPMRGVAPALKALARNLAFVLTIVNFPAALFFFLLALTRFSPMWSFPLALITAWVAGGVWIYLCNNKARPGRCVLVALLGLILLLGGSWAAWQQPQLERPACPYGVPCYLTPRR